jgi:subtilisin family serine protease
VSTADAAASAHAGLTGISKAMDAATAQVGAEKQGTVLVTGTGDIPRERSIGYPSLYPGVIVAAGTNRAGSHSGVSVAGPQTVLSAPADDVITTYKAGGYASITGTSSSAAIIAGAAALVRSRFPSLSADEVIHRLTTTAIDKGATGRDDVYGYGLVNIVGALTAHVPPLNAAAATPTATLTTSAGQHETTRSPTTAAPAHKTANSAAIAALVGTVAVVIASATWVIRRRRRPG